MSAVDATLVERGARYGEFDEHARVTQLIKRAMQSGRRWDDLADDQKERNPADQNGSAESFCQKNDCAKLQRVIIKFTLKD